MFVYTHYLCVYAHYLAFMSLRLSHDRSHGFTDTVCQVKLYVGQITRNMALPFAVFFGLTEIFDSAYSGTCQGGVTMIGSSYRYILYLCILYGIHLLCTCQAAWNTCRNCLSDYRIIFRNPLKSRMPMFSQYLSPVYIISTL